MAPIPRAQGKFLKFKGVAFREYSTGNSAIDPGCPSEYDGSAPNPEIVTD